MHFNLTTAILSIDLASLLVNHSTTLDHLFDKLLVLNRAKKRASIIVVLVVVSRTLFNAIHDILKLLRIVQL